MWLYFYTLNVMVILSSGLKIFEHSLNASEYKKFYHRTADFGPKPGQYNVSGRLQIMDPLIACGVSKYTNKTDAHYTDGSDTNQVVRYNQIYKDQIVLILRGNCTFSKKVSNAELLGAVGVIVGDYNSSNEEWIVMSKDPTTRGKPITIPSVFVPHNTYQWILKLLLSYNTPIINGNDNENENDNHNYFVNVNDGIDGVYAILDEDCEYIAPTSTFWLAAFGIVIIVIPTLWCFIVCMALLRKKIVNYVQQSRRRQHLTQIPVILFKGKGDESLEILTHVENEVGLSVETKKKTILMHKNKDDKYAKLVNVENQEKETVITSNIGLETDTEIAIVAGSFSNNFKNMSRFLLNSFRSKKEAMNPHNDSCAICLEDFQLNEELRLLPCNHGFHTTCVDPWLTKSSELCPMCKQSIFMNANDMQNGCFQSVLKICCIVNRRTNNNDNDANVNVNVIDDNNDTEDTGIIVLSSNQDELVPIDSDHESDHLQSDNDNDNNINQEQPLQEEQA